MSCFLELIHLVICLLPSFPLLDPARTTPFPSLCLGILNRVCECHTSLHTHSCPSTTSLCPMASSYVVLDNGGYHLKYGWAHHPQPSFMPNCVAKIQKSMQSFVGDEISSIQNSSQLSLNRPIDRGYLVNWNLEKEVRFFLTYFFLS
jgi:hypothetical protein